MLATEPAAQPEDIPLITAEYPDFAQYLPWGPFYGVFAPKGTDQAVIDTLAAAYKGWRAKHDAKKAQAKQG